MMTTLKILISDGLEKQHRIIWNYPSTLGRSRKEGDLRNNIRDLKFIKNEKFLEKMLED